MSEDIEKLQRMLEQATAPENTPTEGIDSETASLREAWIEFGQLLEAAHHSPFPLGVGPGVRAMPLPVRPHRRLLPIIGLLAASLLIGVLTTWTSREADLLREPRDDNSQTAAIESQAPTLVQQTQSTASTAGDLQWDDSLDEEITQASQGMLYAQQPSSDSVVLLAYGIGQMQQELTEDNF